MRGGYCKLSSQIVFVEINFSASETGHIFLPRVDRKSNSQITDVHFLYIYEDSTSANQKRRNLVDLTRTWAEATRHYTIPFINIEDKLNTQCLKVYFVFQFSFYS